MFRIHEKLKVPFAAVALPMAAVVTLAVFLLEWFINWEDDLPYYVSTILDL